MSRLSRARLAAYGTIGTSLALLLGCESDYYDGYFGGSSGAGSSGFFDAGVTRRASLCDDVEEDGSCSSRPNDTTCERGTSANYACNGHLRCDQGLWSYEPADRQDCRTDCPSAYTETFAGCGGEGAGSLICEYEKGTCGCAPVYDPVDAGPDSGPEDAGEPADAAAPNDAGDHDGGDAGEDFDPPVIKRKPSRYEWRCMKPQPEEDDADAGARCPRLRPREGQECVRPMTCDYGACVFEDGYRMGCYAGSWVRDISRSTLCDR